MNLKEALTFVRGAVGRNVLAPELEHYDLRGGRITGFNGHLALSAPIGLDIEATPKAAMFFKALEKLDGAKTISLYMTKGGKLTLKGDNFSAHVPCLDKFPYDVKLNGDRYAVPPTILEDLARVLPFTSEDASRPWSQGVLFDRGSVLATNNISLIQVWNGHQLPRINMPKFMAAELLRIKRVPEFIQTDENSLSCIFSDGAWMRSALLSGEWPFEILENLLNSPAQPTPPVEGLEQALDDLAPFVGEGKSSPIYFKDGVVSTSQHEEDGAEVQLAGIAPGPVFNLTQLRLVLGVASAIDFSLYPRPCIFTGDRMRGAVIGRAP